MCGGPGEGEKGGVSMHAELKPRGHSLQVECLDEGEGQGVGPDVQLNRVHSSCSEQRGRVGGPAMVSFPSIETGAIGRTECLLELELGHLNSAFNGNPIWNLRVIFHFLQDGLEDDTA
eukprot:1159207-Pelagomonas_calceolata.AAC.9